MQKKLPSNFELDRYGLHVRLVREEDAEFIVRLRTNEHNSRYIHDTVADVEQQKVWLRTYKQRELEGKEYYVLKIHNVYRGEPEPAAAAAADGDV